MSAETPEPDSDELVVVLLVFLLVAPGRFLAVGYHLEEEGGAVDADGGVVPEAKGRVKV